ncbi:hypothetical protein JKF63_01397 [Porcisia hertigi]|uniref:SP-RING-type domain-containing protein n=1 Tax=Porcisia hertigi TaxID=2761500 RepID=A0A836L0L4_9TRYP|nr:hypothetical protein JKF63_01397 [Porcisia hertigi]
MAHIDAKCTFHGMTDSDWRRLHSRVIPNRVPLPEFKRIVAEGSVHDHYLAKDLHKIMQELRDLLQEHGELKEASVLPLSGRKQELSRAAATAVRLMDSDRNGIPALCRSSDFSSASTGGLGDRQSSTSPSLGSACDPRLSNSGGGSAEDASLIPLPQATSSTLSTTPRRPSRVLPLTDHIREGHSLVSPFSYSSLPRSAAALPLSEVPPVSAPLARCAEAGVLYCEGSVGLVHASAGSAPSESSTRLSTSRAASARFATAVACNPAALRPVADAKTDFSEAPAASPPLPTMPSSTVSSNEIAQLNEFASPFFRILSVPRRFQLRFGSSMLRFEIPLQYVDGVNSRQLRVYMIPLRHPNTPARWPTAKEIVVYVNKQCVMTPWKRSWPDRERQIAETYLPLDITYLLSRNVDAQHVQVDIHNREYHTPAVLVVVQLRSLEEVTESMLSTRLGCRTAVQVRQALLNSSSSSNELASTSIEGLLMLNDEAIYRTYAAIMADDDDDDGLEVDDPVITTKCPISQLPLSIPVRGTRCTHLQCVDLDSFLVSSNKASYWNCALCDAEMRLGDVRVDTILWRYLCTLESLDAYPLYLRLSARASSQGEDLRYHWHPSTRTDENADIVLDDSDSEGKSDVAKEPPLVPGPSVVSAGARSMEAPALRSEPTSAQALNGEGFPTPPAVPLRDEPWPECAGSWRKRAREDDASAEEPRGTADDPIEL